MCPSYWLTNASTPVNICSACSDRALRLLTQQATTNDWHRQTERQTGVNQDQQTLAQLPWRTSETHEPTMGLQLLGPSGIQTTGKFADFGTNYRNRTAVVVPHANPKRMQTNELRVYNLWHKKQRFVFKFAALKVQTLTKIYSETASQTPQLMDVPDRQTSRQTDRQTKEQTERHSPQM